MGMLNKTWQVLYFKGQNLRLPLYFGNGARLGQGVVWVEVSVIRCSQGVFCGKRFASWQSPFREIPDDLSKEPGEVSPAFSPLPYCAWKIPESRRQGESAQVNG